MLEMTYKLIILLFTSTDQLLFFKSIIREMDLRIVYFVLLIKIMCHRDRLYSGKENLYIWAYLGRKGILI